MTAPFIDIEAFHQSGRERISMDMLSVPLGMDL